MTPSQPPPSNGPTTAVQAGVISRGGAGPEPFTETDLFPVLDDGVTPDRSPARSLPTFTAWSPPSTPQRPGLHAGPPTAPPAAAAPQPAAAPRPTVDPPSNLSLVGAALRQRRSLLAIAALSTALALCCGVLIGVLAFSSDDRSAPVAAGGPPTPTAAPPLSTVPAERGTAASTSAAPRPSTSTTATSAAEGPTTSAVTGTGTGVGGAAPGSTPPAADPNALVADFRWSPDPAPAGGSVTIIDRSSGGPTRWVWTWNGNVVSSSQPKGFTTSLRQPTPVTLTVCRGSGDAACASVTKVVPVG